jgi:hypothetical protein
VSWGRDLLPITVGQIPSDPFLPTLDVLQVRRIRTSESEDPGEGALAIFLPRVTFFSLYIRRRLETAVVFPPPRLYKAISTLSTPPFPPVSSPTPQSSS